MIKRSSLVQVRKTQVCQVLEGTTDRYEEVMEEEDGDSEEDNDEEVVKRGFE